MIPDNVCCCDMKDNIQSNVIFYSEVFDEFGIVLREDSASQILLNYCPWCGTRLPFSQRERWFDELESKGFITPLFDDNVPAEYKSKKWRA